MKKLYKRMIVFLLILSMAVPSMPMKVSALDTKISFEDVPEVQWYAQAVRYVYNNKLMSGLKTTVFGPSEFVSRAMFVTILGRMDKINPNDFKESSFADVEPDQWYSSYVEWAVQNKIVSGYDGKTFGTNDSITREQMATIIARYIAYKGITLRDAADAVDGFSDEKYVSAWAKDGLELMRRTGIIKGNADGRFLPLNTAVRAEAASVFMRLHALIFDVDWVNVKENTLPNEENIQFDSKEHVYYADNMLVISFRSSCSAEEIDSVLAYLDGKVTGRIQRIDTFQVELSKTYTLEELKQLSKYLTDTYECIEFATYDSAILAAADAVTAVAPNDPWNKDVSETDWKDTDVDGSNWWLEAIEAPKAWAYKSCFSKIKLGISDSSFDVGHEDLKGRVAFANTVLESRNQTVITSPNILEEVHCHGTHVAGIIGASADNGKGITGIAWNSEMLLAPLYSSEGAEDYLWWDTSLYANFVYLIEAGAKVVNFSQGKTNYLSSSKTAFSTDFIAREGRMSAYYVAKLLERNYDFVVVQSAGNGLSDTGNGVPAIQNGWFCSITDTTPTSISGISIDEVLNRVIIVGAVRQSGSGYEMCSFSNYGDQVDICAPGGNIYSTVPGDTFWGFELWGGYHSFDGTSMAAPVVTGVCGLVWSAAEDLTGEEVKEIVCSSTNLSVRENYGTRRIGLVNAHLSVQEAVYMEYLKNKEYKVYTDNWYEKPAEYSIFDINNDYIPELIINSNTSMGWFNTMICTYDTKENKVVVMLDVYNWSGVRHFDKYILYSETRYTVAGGYGGQEFYAIENNKLKNHCFVGYKPGGSGTVYFIEEGGSERTISKAEYDFIFQNAKHFEYESLKNIK